MQDIRQSDRFALFMERLGWKTVILNKEKVYLRKFPLLGSFAKMPRPVRPFRFDLFLEFLENNQLYFFKIAPNITVESKRYPAMKKAFLSHGLDIDKDPYNPVTTIFFDLTRPEQELFNDFSEAKRRAVRRAAKNDIIVKESNDIDSFVTIRKYQYRPFGFMFSNETRQLWKAFAPDKAKLLLAYQKGNKKALSGILLLFHYGIAYYWFASSLPAGKKLYAPSLLVYEALKLAKRSGAKMFDFEGIYDDRFPEAGKTWKGFTKFKEGFGGKKVIFSENFFLRLKIKSPFRLPWKF